MLKANRDHKDFGGWFVVFNYFFTEILLLLLLLTFLQIKILIACIYQNIKHRKLRVETDR